MSRWLISVPVWGERCTEVFCAAALPALEQAIGEFCCSDYAPHNEVVLVAHTDQPRRLAEAATRIKIEQRSVPAGLRDFDCMSQAHREVLQMAVRGDTVVLLTADMVVSAKALTYCARILANPQKCMVACAAVRAVQEGRLPDTGDAETLMRWAWDNRHPIVADSTWPYGRAADLSRTYFGAGDDNKRDCSWQTVVARWCLPHPLAVRIDGRPLRFLPTVDANLIQCFQKSEVHLATDCRELAVVELSPRDKDWQRSDRTIEQRLAADEFRVPDPMQRWFLSQQVVLVGTARDCGDAEVVGRVLALDGGAA